MVSSAIASRALTPAGRHRFALATKMLLWSHFVEPQPSVSSSPILQTVVGSHHPQEVLSYPIQTSELYLPEPADLLGPTERLLHPFT